MRLPRLLQIVGAMLRNKSGKLRRLLIVAFALLVVLLALVSWGVFLLVQKLGMGAIPVLIVLFALAVWGTKILVARAMKWIFMLPFRLKGKALRGGTATVHSARLEGTGDKGRSVLVEVTIAPQDPPPSGKFTTWELGEVGLVPVGVNAMDDNCDSRIAFEQLEYWDDGRYVKDEGFKLSGPQRLRFRATIPGTRQDYRFHYYFEHFGELQVPAEPGSVGN